jgi:hypothetical protein
MHSKLANIPKTDIQNNLQPKKINSRVDINVLLAKVREKEKKATKENLVWLGLVGSVVVITGVIASF